MRIFLVGFMGSGKTTMGRKLAGYLGYLFIDLDKILEDEAGMSIAEFFKRNGEEAFREFERRMLQSSTFNDNTVIATGGGAPCFFDNMEWMNKNGTTVYLMMSPKGLVDRLKHSTDRPLIKGLNEEEMLKFIAGKLEERELFYKQATYVVNGIGLTAEKLAKNIGLS